MSSPLDSFDIESIVFFDIIGNTINISEVFTAESEVSGSNSYIKADINGDFVYAHGFGAGAVKKRKEVTENE